ncbi:Helix-turn-helix domain protein [Corynebacterium capitovis DSM 44611]|uniref:helix-turn-helix domain-containing protein n=1 Tax=Corynebacterium capitovis TaxID=131081 RepID=UPI000A029B57|nr:helix-turn-helix domain-containing protein [Corynebacterium capitovis]WKD56901.1 Helix-turn-helix domain protein [Corynebacterium capitovis DSM 44611]
MPSPFPPDKDFFTTAEAAKYTGCSPRTLEKRRANGQSPTFTKKGRSVVYRREDLDAYVDIDSFVEKFVDAAPHFTDDQRRRLVGVLVGGASA